jgi:L-fuconolactonase
MAGGLDGSSGANKLLRIDSHQHFWRYSAPEYAWIDDTMAVLQRDFQPADLEPLLRQNGFAGCVAVQAHESVDETRRLVDLAAAAPFVVGVVGWVDFLSPDLDEQLERFAGQSVVRGYRHTAQSERDDFLARPDFVHGVARLRDRELCYDLLVYPRQLPAATRLARQLPRQVFVLDHIAKPEIREGKREPWRTQIRELAACPNVYCKLSGLVTEAHWSRWRAADIRPYVDTVLECFGPSRLMIGSDWPVCTLAASYAEVMQLARDSLSQLSSDERAGIWGGNAVRCYGLSLVGGIGVEPPMLDS